MDPIITPIPMILHCPLCHERHIDRGEFATKPHHTHACQKCGIPWRPAIVPTVGVHFLPGFKDEPKVPPPPAPFEFDAWIDSVAIASPDPWGRPYRKGKVSFNSEHGAHTVEVSHGLAIWARAAIQGTGRPVHVRVEFRNEPECGAV